MWADALVGALLLVIACAVFRDVVFTAGAVPAGLDLLSHYSRESVVRRALSDGAFPFWNPYEFSGFPLQADPQIGLFYPPNFVLRLLPLAGFLTWSLVFHVWLFGLGAYVLCRVVGVGRPVAAIAAVALMLGGITMPRVYAGHIDLLRTVAWVPLVMAAAFRSLDRSRGAPSVLTVFVLTCEVLGGYPQVILYTISCIALYAFFSMWWPAQSTPNSQPPSPRLRRVRRSFSDGGLPSTKDENEERMAGRSWRHAFVLGREVALTCVLVAALTAFQSLPAARLITTGARVSGVPYEVASTPAFDFNEFVRFLTLPLGNRQLPPEFWETSAYIGLLLAALAPFALVVKAHRRRVVFFALLAAVTLAFASGGPAYRLHHAIFPMFRIPGRFLVLFAIATAVLGAVALERLTQSRKADAAVVGWGRRLVLLFVGALVLVDTGVYARRFVESRQLDDRFLRALPFTPTPGGRVLSLCEDRAHPLELAALGVPSVDGYNAYYLSDYARLIRTARGETADTFTSGAPRMGALATLPNMDIADMLNVTEVVTCKTVDHPALSLLTVRGPLLVYRNAGAAGRVVPVALEESECAQAPEGLNGRFRDYSADARIESLIADRADGRLRLLITTTKPHLLLIAEPHYPERRVWIDRVETTVFRTNIALSAVCVGPGQHLVELRYLPITFLVGAGISSVAAALWIGLAWFSRAAPEPRRPLR